MNEAVLSWPEPNSHKYTPGAICTMPRSGTWYSYYLFEFLDCILSKRKKVKPQHYFEIYHSLNLLKLHVHSIFPGFIEEYDGKHRHAWELLNFHHSGVNYGYKSFSQGKDVFYPSRNKLAKIVYIFRNPLDQAISLFQSHVNRDESIFYYQKNGISYKSQNPAEFFRHIALNSYIKQYFTYCAMQEKYRENLLMVEYEDLVRMPFETYKSMLKFFNVQVDEVEVARALIAALELSTMDNLAKLENKLGHAIIGKKRPESHMHDGEIGKWKRFLRQEDIEHCINKLGDFDISLNEFILE